MAVACPLWYRNKMMDTFDWSKWRANYQKVEVSEEKILRKWKKDNKKRKKKRPGMTKGRYHIAMEYLKRKTLIN